MIKYTCKSVEGTHRTKTAHHFPPYHIGNRLGAARFRGDYRAGATRGEQDVPAPSGRLPLPDLSIFPLWELFAET